MKTTLTKALCFLAGLTALAASSLSQEEPVELADTIVVTATRTPITYTEVSRTITVLNPEQIAAAPARNIIDILTYVTGIEVRRQTTGGVRADISIRGGTFGQTLILVDGMKVTDPQTGHHNLDLPFDLSDIERIEIVRGAGSKLYGPNAMSGVINFITKPSTTNRFRLESTVGEHRLAEQRLNASVVTGRVGHRVTASRRVSSGFRNNTEFDLTNLAYRSTIRTRRGPIDIAVGYTKRKFGAYQLYLDQFPNEWETTSTVFTSAAARLLIGNSLLSPKLFWRRHEDDFVLDRLRPDWYRNRHTTDHYGFELQTTVPSSLGEAVLGGEIAADKIVSSNLTDQDRIRGGIFAEQRLSLLGRLSIVPGISVYWHEGYGWNAWPGLDIGYQPHSEARIYFTITRSYRVPDNTELFYEDPGNKGNSQLRPEEAVSFELGSRYSGRRLDANGSVFVRHGTNQIDWARRPGETEWWVQNVDRVTTSGLEIQIGLPSPVSWSWLDISQAGIRYAYLDSERSGGGYEYKYLLEHLRHQVIFDLNCRWFGLLDQNWAVRYARRMLGGEYTVIDTRVSTSHGRGSVFVEISNLFDEAYSEIRNLPMPGRWVRAGFTLELTAD